MSYDYVEYHEQKNWEENVSKSEMLARIHLSLFKTNTS
jgi:hypothetical protein